MQVKIKKLDPKAVIPKYSKPGDMGMDLTAISLEYNAEKDLYIYHTGLAFEIPEGYGMLVFPRSSNTKTESYLPNSTGVIDSCYRGEVLVCFKNRTSFELALDRDDISTNEVENPEDLPYMYAPHNVGDRVAQLVILPYPKIEFVEAEELSKTERGTGGFGSTGKK